MDELRRLLGNTAVKADGFTISWTAGKLDVSFATGRHHTVRYRLHNDHYYFQATIATQHQLEVLAGATRQRYSVLRKKICREILRQNEHTEAVCFRLDNHDRLEAVITQRAATLHHAELVYYAAQLAREADRFEALLSAKDRW